jgi:hypothetical protein
MKTAALLVSVLLFLIVLIAVIRAIVQPKFPLFKQFDIQTQPAYMVLAACAAVLLAFFAFDLRIASADILGVRLQTLEKKVDTFSAQMEAFFRGKKIETFNRQNWNRVQTIGKATDHVLLEVTLEQEPIPGSIEVLEGPLPMPEQEYYLNGKRLQFPANSDKPDSGITVKYFPRVNPPQP